LQKKYWGQHLWARGYFAVTVGNVNTEDVQRYIYPATYNLTIEHVFETAPQCYHQLYV
jgi:hypothetical protein